MKKILTMLVLFFVFSLIWSAFSACENTEYWYVSVNGGEGYQLIANTDETNSDGLQKVKVQKGKYLQFSLILKEGYSDDLPSVNLDGNLIGGTRDSTFSDGVKWDFSTNLNGDGILSILDSQKARYSVSFSSEQALSPKETEGIFTINLYDMFNIKSTFISFPQSISAFIQTTEAVPLSEVMYGQELVVIIIARSEYSLNGIELQYKKDGDEDYSIVTDIADDVINNSRTFRLTVTGNMTISPVVCATEKIANM